ncbi:uncharacterized protein LOC108917416 [Anoplophora glabripennis]|uniref:uncharacterized protein LOC108917416 n=1 Tax=Anoplophora glabripennis TaxID=217634 RepID=UPI00087445F8|nr:uncharacterized protein LOC108917416 [Anoplophora glabripennis]
MGDFDMVFKLTWIIFYVILFDTVLGALDKALEKTGSEYGWVPVSNPPENLQVLQDVNILVTYADNMFGPSVKMKKGKLLNSTGTLYLKGQALKAPNLSQIKFDLLSVNHSGYAEKGGRSPGLPKEQRTKRGVFHLYNMVSCATGCNPLAYKGYGCYCGFLGSGYAVDGIDRCCKTHDWCYDKAKCPMFLEYIVPYFWKCYYNRPICAVDHGEFGGPGSCASRLCECDRVLSECLRRYPCPSSRTFCKSSPLRLLQNALMFYP